MSQAIESLISDNKPLKLNPETASTVVAIKDYIEYDPLPFR